MKHDFVTQHAMAQRSLCNIAWLTGLPISWCHVVHGFTVALILVGIRDISSTDLPTSAADDSTRDNSASYGSMIQL
jgi:hypothetical protein